MGNETARKKNRKKKIKLNSNTKLSLMHVIKQGSPMILKQRRKEKKLKLNRKQQICLTMILALGAIFFCLLFSFSLCDQRALIDSCFIFLFFLVLFFFVSHFTSSSILSHFPLSLLFLTSHHSQRACRKCAPCQTDQGQTHAMLTPGALSLR